jgi:hypothetical protein
LPSSRLPLRVCKPCEQAWHRVHAKTLVYSRQGVFLVTLTACGVLGGYLGGHVHEFGASTCARDRPPRCQSISICICSYICSCCRRLLLFKSTGSSSSIDVVATAELNRPWSSEIMPLPCQLLKHSICSTPSPVMFLRHGVSSVPMPLNAHSGASLISTVE